jgi:transposase
MYTTSSQTSLSLDSVCSERKSLTLNEGEFAPNGAGRKANLNRSIHDAAPAMLLQIIKTKAEEAEERIG